MYHYSYNHLRFAFAFLSTYLHHWYPSIFLFVWQIGSFTPVSANLTHYDGYLFLSKEFVSSLKYSNSNSQAGIAVTPFYFTTSDLCVMI